MSIIIDQRQECGGGGGEYGKGGGRDILPFQQGLGLIKRERNYQSLIQLGTLV